jgi:hypothetical protein
MLTSAMLTMSAAPVRPPMVTRRGVGGRPCVVPCCAGYREGQDDVTGIFARTPTVTDALMHSSATHIPEVGPLPALYMRHACLPVIPFPAQRCSRCLQPRSDGGTHAQAHTHTRTRSRTHEHTRACAHTQAYTNTHTLTESHSYSRCLPARAMDIYYKPCGPTLPTACVVWFHPCSEPWLIRFIH